MIRLKRFTGGWNIQQIQATLELGWCTSVTNFATSQANELMCNAQDQLHHGSVQKINWMRNPGDKALFNAGSDS